MSLNISEISKLFNISAETLRFYELEGILNPTRNPNNNYRMYSTWDILNLMECIRYKNFGMTTKNTAKLIHFKHLNVFTEHLRRQDRLLLDTIRYNQLLHSRITEYINILDAAQYNLGNFYFKRLPEQYFFTFLESSGDNYEDILYDNKIFSSWSSNLHFLDMALYIPSCYLNTYAHPEKERWAYVISKEYAEQLGLPVDENVLTLPSSINLSTIVDMGEKGDFDLSILENTLKYIEKQNLVINGDLMGKTLIRFHENNSYHRYMEIQIPISRKSEY